MRYFLFLTLLLTFAACDTGDAKKNVESGTEVTSDEPSTDQWITALLQLQQALINNDKDELLELFPFPIDEGHFYTIVHADSLSERYAVKNNGQLPRPFVEKYFDTFYRASGIKDLNTVIHRINIEKLRDHGMLEGDEHRGGEACIKHYSIKLSGDEATIVFGNNTDNEYLRNHPDEEMACTEYTYLLRLKLVNNRLSFIRIELAG